MIPEVSVVIPNYNYAQHLIHAVDSVLRQSMRNLELIVVDNFSTDGSDAVVQQRRDSRVSFHNYSNNGVIAGSRNFGLNLARGEFVAFLDSDDLWHSTKLAKQLRLMSDDTFASFHDLRAIAGGIPRKIRGFSLGGQPLQQMLIGGNPIPLSSVMCRRAALQDLGGFPEKEELVGVEDFALWLKAAENGLKFRYLPKPLGSYRVHDSASSSINIAERTERIVASYSDVLDTEQKRLSQGFVLYAKAIRARSEKNFSEETRFLVGCIRSGNWKFAWRAFIRIGQNFITLKLLGVERQSPGRN